MNESRGMSISIADHPDPVLQYEIQDDIPIVSATNDAFDVAIGVAESEPITAVFEQFDTVESPGEEPPEAQLRSGEPVEIVLESTDDAVQYLAHVLAPDVNGGAIVFTDRDRGTVEPFTRNTEVAQVASAIGHDLRNPLDVAGAHLEAARETGAAEHFDAIDAAHDRMERIIQEALTLARGESTLSVDSGVSIDDIADRAWQTVETGAWSLDLDASLPTVRADADRLQRLFENLFRNAVEHAADSGTVRVSALDGETAGVFVADDGPGIPMSKRDDVFTPGYTIEGGGTGLGLAIVDRITEAHGWTVSIEESECNGTRIEIRFDTGGH